MLMSHLQAMFRALTGTGLPLIQIMERASGCFAKAPFRTIMPPWYADGGEERECGALQCGTPGAAAPPERSGAHN